MDRWAPQKQATHLAAQPEGKCNCRMVSVCCLCVVPLLLLAATRKGAIPATSTQRCAVRVTENPGRYEACATSPTYPGPSSTKCTQVSIASPPFHTRCQLGDCTANDGTCWVQVWSGEVNSRVPGWVQSGPDCLDQPYIYLAPCDGSTCKVGKCSMTCAC